jgi:hypothetical protein
MAEQRPRGALPVSEILPLDDIGDRPPVDAHG